MGRPVVTRDEVLRRIDRRSFCVLSTRSAAGVPHAAGVLYARGPDPAIYVHTDGGSRKGRNLRVDPRVGVVIPVRRVPVGPPSTVTLQRTARLLDPEGVEIHQLLERGWLRGITSHGELEMPGGVFARIPLEGRAVTHGLGLSLRQLIRDPVRAGGAVVL